MDAMPPDDAHILADGLDALGIEQPQGGGLDNLGETVAPRVGRSLRPKRTADRRDEDQFHALVPPEAEHLAPFVLFCAFVRFRCAFGALSVRSRCCYRGSVGPAMVLRRTRATFYTRIEMQKRELIPTPLLPEKSRPTLQIAELSLQAKRRSMMSIVGFIVSVAWLWWKTSFMLLFTGRSATQEGAQRLRLFLEDMGGMWVKAGQIMSLRRDLFRKETCDELSRLQDSARGFPFASVKQVIEEDLGQPLEELFSEFDPVPVAAASIGQTHSAHLRENGARVAVKVQRPFIADAFARDFKYIHFVTRWLQRLGVASHVRWDEMVGEISRLLSDELDYRMEASSIARMRRCLRHHKVYAPKVFAKYCSKRLLVMEFIEGVFMSDYIKVAHKDPARLAAWVSENGIDPDKVGRRLYTMKLRQMGEDNLYHCDLHPGNIILQRNSRFAIIDFGSVGNLEKTRHRRYQALNAALAQRDFTKTIEIFLLQGPPLPNGKDITAMKAEILNAFRTWDKQTRIKRLPYQDRSLGKVFGEIAQIMQKYQCGVAWDFLGLTRADLTLDASLLVLSPALDVMKLVRKYEQKASQRAMRRARRPKVLAEGLGKLHSALELPTLLAENMWLEGEWLRKRAMAFEGRVSSIAVILRAFLSLLALIAVGLFGVALGAYARVHGNSAALKGSWFGPIFDALPALRAEAWIVAAAAALFAFGKLNQIRSYVQEKNYDTGNQRR
jgi:ubiquinone biosynthesis protein